MIPNLAMIVGLYILYRLSEPFWLNPSHYKGVWAHRGAKLSGVIVSLLVIWLLYEIVMAGMSMQDLPGIR